MDTYLIFTNGERLKLGTIYCIGKNYPAHIKEMGDAVPEDPVVFIKPPAAYMPDGSKIRLPAFSENIHHEVELVIVIGDNCSNVKDIEAGRYIAGYGVGVDLTLRDIQEKAKKEGNPWAVAKGFYGSAPLSKIVPAGDLNSLDPHFDLELKVNGVTRQRGNTGAMARRPAELISYLSAVFTLRTGDCIFTGTPEGVGPIVRGDKLEARLGEYAGLFFEVF